MSQLHQIERQLPRRPSHYLAPGNICGRCGGSGRLRCSHCGGSGQSTFTRLCPACNGQSAVTCSSCWGTGRR